MTTTAEFQQCPDYFESRDACTAFSKESWKNPVTNARYGPDRHNSWDKGYNQCVFHAGDVEQFDEYRDAVNGDACLQDIPLHSNTFNLWQTEHWDGYRSPTAEVCSNTFDYIFHKFKKGIYVKILAGELKVFLPFSKNKFRNEWGDRIKVDTKRFADIEAFLRYINTIDNIERKKANLRPYPFNKAKINFDTSTWFANNCILRYEFPVNEGDSNVLNVKNMMEELCKERRIPDIEFFMNRRDFPLLKKNGTEPYDAIWGKNHPLVSYAFDKYLPILSMSKTSEYADVLIPTHEDWARVQGPHNKWFPPCTAYNDNFDMPWIDRKPTAVFRGSTTGCGVTVNSNQRLRLAYIASNTGSLDGIPLLDAGVTKWKTRPRQIEGSELQTIEPGRLMPFDLVSYLTPSQQSHYKYIINVAGHVSAFRLSYELSMGCTVIMVETPWKIWFSDMLIPYVHYVPVKFDLSDLVDRVEWCRKHDKECETMASNAKLFFQTYLQRDNILDFMQKTLVDLKQEIGIYLYNVVSPLDIQIEEERNTITRFYPSDTDKSISDISKVPRGGRTYGTLQGTQWLINMIIDRGSFRDVATKVNKIFSNKLGIVQGYALAGIPLAVKSTNDPQKKKEHIHEAYIGTEEINKLVKLIPNFAYIYGSFEDGDSYNVITEYIHGITFSDYISGPSFKYKDFLLIILQLCLALEVAQNSCGFVHWDLAPWNIMIQERDTPVEFDYLLSHDKIYRVETTLIPVIIDFGKSHVIHNQRHHGFIDMYRTSTIQDPITLILKSVKEILGRKSRVVDYDLTLTFRLIEFMTGTDRYPKATFSNVQDLKTFVSNESRYQPLTLTGKGQLEELGPMDLFSYIKEMVNYTFPIKTTKVYNSVMDRDNAMQVFEYMLSSDDQSRAQTYLNVFSRLETCIIPKPTNLFLVYYTAQSLSDGIIAVYNSMATFVKKAKLDPTPFQNSYDNVLATIRDTYSSAISTLEEKNVSHSVDEFATLIPSPYTEKTFLLPGVINNIIDDLLSVDQDLDDLSWPADIVRMMFANDGEYSLSEAHRTYYLKVFEDLLNVKGVNMINNSATLPTLRHVSKEVYSRNIEVLSQKLTDGNCDDSERYMEMYEQVLSEVQ